LSVDNIIRFAKEDKYKFLIVEYVLFNRYGFNLCVKVEQKAAMNIVKETTDFTVEGWKIGKEIPSWVHSYDNWVNDVSINSRSYPVGGNNESTNDADTEVVTVNDPNNTDSVVVGYVCDIVDYDVDEEREAHYLDGLKVNGTGSKTPSKNPDFFSFVEEDVHWNEIDDSDGDEKKVTEVQGEEVNWSDDKVIQSALVASTDGKWQNEAHGRPTNSAS